MSKKLKKFLNDAEKTESKIAELEEYLRNVRAAQKKEEDNEIVRAIRSTKLGGRDLLALLENIQAGNVTFQTTVNHENKTSEEAEMEDDAALDMDEEVTESEIPAPKREIERSADSVKRPSILAQLHEKQAERIAEPKPQKKKSHDMEL